MNCQGCAWKHPITCKECRKEIEMTGTERKMLYLLQENAELEREIRVGKEAEEKKKKNDKIIRGCAIIISGGEEDESI